MQPPIQIANILFSISYENGHFLKADSNWIYEEKKDGVRAILQNQILSGRNRVYKLPGEVPQVLENCCFDGELVNGVYWVFDLLTHNGSDLRQMPLRERRQALQSVSQFFPPWMRQIPHGANGSEFLKAVIRDGGEGIVAKDLSLPYGKGWFKCKKLETFDCIITARNDHARSFALGQHCNGTMTPCGNVASLSRALWESIEVGNVVEIACHSRTASGKFREPRILRIRADKPAIECIA